MMKKTKDGVRVNEIDWLKLSERASVDPGELKRRLDLVAVCEELGILLEPGHDGKWHGLCPFHDDTRPSFDVYERDDGTQACGCMACDFGPSNDVYDLLKYLRGYSFGQALGEAQALSVATRAQGPRKAEVTKRDVDIESFVQTAREHAGDDLQAIRGMLLDRDVTVPAPWLIEEFRLGVTPDGAGVVVPHFDRNGEVIAAKIRRATTLERPWKPIAVSGSKLSELYGIWRDHGHNRVILVEGESDAWTVAHMMRYEDYEVFGLPSGAAARPRREWVEFLSGREVTLLFDADDTGRLALRNWSAALGVVAVATLNEGEDATSEKRDVVYDAITHATTVGTTLSAGLVEAPFGGYVRANDQNQTPISDFTLRLERMISLSDDEGSVFEVAFPNGKIASLASSELSNDAKFRTWANRYNYVWSGTTKDVQEVLRMLVSDSVFRPRLRGTRVAGLHDGSFVLPKPHGNIGSASWSYLPPVADVEIDRVIDLVPDSRWDRHIPLTLSQLHRPDVITPLLGWIAAAPLRSMVKAFPIMAVVGGAGWGKSTLIREVLATFGFNLETTLSATTPHAVASFAAATNAIPVWFDEFRHGTRSDTRAMFVQTLREAWEASSSWKGGVGDNKQALTKMPARAPIIVSGEDAFEETSHVTRMLMVRMPATGKNPRALSALYDAHRQGFGRAYLEWLVEQIDRDTLPCPPLASADERVEHVHAVAVWGYKLLNAFCRDVIGSELPVAYDDSMVKASHKDAVSPTQEAIDVCEGRLGRGGVQIVWRENDDVCVRVHDLVREAKDLHIPLAGGPKAIRAELDERYETFDETDFSGKYVRLRKKLS